MYCTRETLHIDISEEKSFKFNFTPMFLKIIYHRTLTSNIPTNKLHNQYSNFWKIELYVIPNKEKGTNIYKYLLYSSIVLDAHNLI